GPRELTNGRPVEASPNRVEVRVLRVRHQPKTEQRFSRSRLPVRLPSLREQRRSEHGRPTRGEQTAARQLHSHSSEPLNPSQRSSPARERRLPVAPIKMRKPELAPKPASAGFL